MKMLSGLFPIQTNSLISFHHQYNVLLHQCTTFKELLSDVPSVDIIENALHSHIYTPSPILVLTVECCYYSCSSVVVHQQLQLNKKNNNITK